MNVVENLIVEKEHHMFAHRVPRTAKETGGPMLLFQYMCMPLGQDSKASRGG